MMNAKRLFTIFILTVLVTITACQPVSIYNQRATATAYSSDYMTTAMRAAEDGAMALCNLDFDAGPEAYEEQICENSTQLGCAFFMKQVAEAWADLARAYSADQLECELSTSRFLEEGQQFGMLTQYWQVNLQGTKGWSTGEKNREYWLQVAEENGQWKLNRVLTSDEVAYYLAIDSMQGEE